MVGPDFDVLVMLQIRSGSRLGFLFIAAIEFVSGAGYSGRIDCKKIVVPETLDHAALDVRIFQVLMSR